MAYRPSAVTDRTGFGSWLAAICFRPLFLGAALWASLAVAVWVLSLFEALPEPHGMSWLRWHAHEMLFGFLPAVMAGYVLSVTANWSGRLPASGRPLLGLAAIWLAGRLLPPWLPALPASLTDAAFPIAMTALLLREALAAPKSRVGHGLMLFPILAAASVAHRLTGDDAAATLMARGVIALAALLVAAIGGRLIPSLISSHAPGELRLPAAGDRLDAATLALTFPMLVLWAVLPDSPLTAAAGLTVAVLHMLRLYRWKVWAIRRGELVALVTGYGWLCAALLGAGLAARPLGLLPQDAVLHSFTVGVIGSMTLAVMTRLATTRGAAPKADRTIAFGAILLVQLAGVSRVIAPLAAGSYSWMIGAATAFWAAAWLLFVIACLLPKAARALCSRQK